MTEKWTSAALQAAAEKAAGLGLPDGYPKLTFVVPDDMVEAFRDEFKGRAEVVSVSETRPPVPGPICKTEGCPNVVESSEDYCIDCLDRGADQPSGES